MTASSPAVINLLYARRRQRIAALSEKFAFHGTSRRKLAAIRAVGLLPQNGENTKDAEGHETEGKVCVTGDPKIARKYAGTGGVVLRVDLGHPELEGATPQPDEHERDSVTINQRIPPAAISVARVEAQGLRRVKLSEAYARDLKLKRDFRGIVETTSHELALSRGFREAHRISNQFGTVVRYFHPGGDNLIVTELPEELRDRGAPWETKWEYHSIDGVKSTGFNLPSLQNHLRG